MSLKTLFLLLTIGLVALIYFLKHFSPFEDSTLTGEAPVTPGTPSKTEMVVEQPRVPPERVALVAVQRMFEEKGPELLRPIGDGPGTIDRAELARLRSEVIDFGKTMAGAERKEFANGVTLANLLDAAAADRVEHHKRYRRALENPSESSLYTEADRARMQRLEVERIEKGWQTRAETFRKQALSVFQ